MWPVRVAFFLTVQIAWPSFTSDSPNLMVTSMLELTFTLIGLDLSAETSREKETDIYFQQDWPGRAPCGSLAPEWKQGSGHVAAQESRGEFRGLLTLVCPQTECLVLLPGCASRIKKALLGFCCIFVAFYCVEAQDEIIAS